MFIGWPSYISCTYDFEVIQKRKPAAVVVVYEILGASGGEKLQHFLHACGAKAALPAWQPRLSADQFSTEHKYNVEHFRYEYTVSKTGLLGDGELVTALVLLRREDVASQRENSVISDVDRSTRHNGSQVNIDTHEQIRSNAVLGMLM
jgi:hypothetical protein